MEFRRSTLAKTLLLAVLVVFAVKAPSVAAPGHGEGASGEEHAHGNEASERHSDEKAAYDVDVRTHPRAAEIVPDQGMTEIVFDVRKDEQAAEDVQLSYRLYAPPKAFWFGTEFPIVEGSQLLSGTVTVPEGTHTASLILPIRGTYELKTTVRGPAGVRHQNHSFTVSENTREVLNLSVFLMVLFLLGAVAGYFLSGRTARGTSSSLVFLVGGVIGSALFLAPASVDAHGEGDWDPHKLEDQVGVEKIRSEAEFQVRTFPNPVTVGEMLNVDYEVMVAEPASPAHQGHDHAHESTAKSVEDLLVESIFVQSAGGLEMVRQSSWFSGGEGSINVQLFEGAPHYLVSRFYRPTDRYARRGGHDHAHGESGGHETRTEHETSTGAEKPPWEAELLHQFSSGTYEVRFGRSADPSMKWLTLPADVEDPLSAAREGFQDCKTVDPGSTLNAEGGCYELNLNEDETTYELVVNDGGNLRVFTEHRPREFNLTVYRNGQEIDPLRQFVPGKGEYLGRSVNRVPVEPVQPPFDDIFKALVTLLAVVALGYYVGSRGPGWIARR